MSWIPARVPPEPDTDVLVVMHDEIETWVDSAYLDKHGYWRCAGSHILVMPQVLYWQPFPALPDLAGGMPRPAIHPPTSSAGGVPCRSTLSAPEAP